MNYVGLKDTITLVLLLLPNAITKWGDEPTRMTENSTEEELKDFISKEDNPFGINTTDKNGVKLFTMVADTNFNKRYAWDMLRHFWEAEAGGYICKIIVQSKKGTALGVKNDRDDLFFKVVEYCNLAYEVTNTC